MASSSSSSIPVTSKLYVLQYELVPNMQEQRASYRAAHLAHVQKQIERGNLILGGSVDNPPSGALSIWRNMSRDDMEQYALQDPYVINGCVSKYTIKSYMAVAGDEKLADDLIKI
jgi:uncharacterized protein YciI